jgi:hypothetical protein
MDGWRARARLKAVGAHERKKSDGGSRGKKSRAQALHHTSLQASAGLLGQDITSGTPNFLTTTLTYG